MKRILPLVITIVLAGLGFGSASVVNLAVGRLLAVPADVEWAEIDPTDAAVVSSSPEHSVDQPAGEPEKAALPEADGLSLRQYIDQIVARNIFDAASIGGEPDNSVGVASSDLNVKLVATLVAEPENFSSALIVDASGVALGYGIRDKIGEAEIVGIEVKRVSLKWPDGRTEYLELSEGDTPTPTAEAAGEKPEGAEPGITKVSDTKFVVERSLIDKYLSDIDALSSMANARPRKGPDGEIEGFRLAGIRRNSPLFQLGIKNGDVIHNVNGMNLTSMQDAMSAFQSLQSQSSFSFEITRRGQKQTMEYEIR